MRRSPTGLVRSDSNIAEGPTAGNLHGGDCAGAVVPHRQLLGLPGTWPVWALAAFAAAALSSCVVSTTAPHSSKKNGQIESSTGDLPETGLQGEVPLADQQSGRSLEGYRKGMRLVGQNTIRDRGGNLQLATFGHCAYVGTASIPPAAHSLEGIAVLDVRTPENPRLVRIISSPAGYSSWEGLKASEQAGILVSFVTSRTAPIAMEVKSVPESWKPGVNPSYADAFEVYDVSHECENPKRLATINTRKVLTGGLHGLRLSPDGRTAYVSSMLAGLSEDDSQTSLAAFDLSDPASPKLLAKWKWSDDSNETIDFGYHDGAVSNDGNTLFWGTIPMYSRRNPNDISRVMIQAFDVSSIQSRSRAPGFNLQGSLHWQDCSREMAMAHGAQYAIIRGKPYLIAGGECVGIQLHVIDVSDPTQMRLVSTYNIEANDQQNAQIVTADNATYWAHYFGVDSTSEATSLFVTWFGSGLRAIDIRDPTHLLEFAYLNPPAHPKSVFCLMMCATTYEVSTSDVKYDRATGNIWFVGANGGFYVAHLTESAGANGLARQP